VHRILWLLQRALAAVALWLSLQLPGQPQLLQVRPEAAMPADGTPAAVARQTPRPAPWRNAAQQ